MNRDVRPLMERAEEYVGLLAEGSEIVDDTDGAFVAPFHHLLGALLFKYKRLYLHRRGDREVVTSTPPWLLDRLQGGASSRPDLRAVLAQRRIVCRKCSAPFFDCEHQATLVVAGIREPFLPVIGVRRKAAA